MNIYKVIKMLSFSVFTYNVVLRVGEVGPSWVEEDVYIIMYGEQGQTGRRLLKQFNPSKQKEKVKTAIYL